MNEGQQQLLPDSRVPKPTDDYLGLFPERVMPTAISVLEQGSHLLFIRRLSVGTKITQKQESIFRQLVRTGELTDSEGSITVLCIWGLQGQRGRSIAIYDHMGIREAPANDELVRTEIRRWWDRHSDGFR